MLKGVTYRSGLALLAALLFVGVGMPAHAEENFGDLSISGYADLRVIAPPREVAWLNGGLSKFRYGNDEGNFRFAEAVVQGDGKVPAIAAASILAKVSRDREMAAFEVIYPGYGIGGHKGYPTPVHLEALARLGPTPIHRRSFAPVRLAYEARESLTQV